MVGDLRLHIFYLVTPGGGQEPSGASISASEVIDGLLGAFISALSRILGGRGLGSSDYCSWVSLGSPAAGLVLLLLPSPRRALTLSGFLSLVSFLLVLSPSLSPLHLRLLCNFCWICISGLRMSSPFLPYFCCLLLSVSPFLSFSTSLRLGLVTYRREVWAGRLGLL